MYARCSRNLGFDQTQFDALIKGDAKIAHGFAPGKPAMLPTDKPPARQFKIIIDGKDEADHAKWIEELAERGEEFERRGASFTAPSM